MEIPSFNALLEKSIIDNWDKDALTDFKGATLQYHDVARKIEKLHIMFESSGVVKGDKIALCGRNSASWAVAFLATLTYGAVAVPILHEFTADQIHNIVNHSEAKLLFVGDYVATIIDQTKMPNLEGIIISVCVALVLRHTTFKGEQEPFVMEMPPYHIPTLKGVLMHMWERTVLYLKKAGTFILGASILVWFLTAYPMDVDYSQDFDAAKDQVTAEMEQKQADILQSYGLSAIEDNDELNTMYESMVAAADEAADEEDEDEADTGNALNPAAALSSVEDQVKNSEEEDNLFMGKYPQSFADLQEQNPAVFAQALPLFDAKANADDESSKLDDQQTAEKLQQSYAARLGKFVEPVIAPLGFDWKIGVGLIACTAAKEVMVSTLGTIYSVGGDDTHESGIVAYLRDDPDFNQAVALSLMVFTLLYMPCVAAMAVIKRETGSWKMLLACDAMCLVLSYVLAFITYHLALMAGLGA